MRFLAVVTLLVCGTCSCSKKLEGYYWREYSGKIPKDALVAGLDDNGSDIFIGQGYLRSAGLIPSRVLPSAKYIHVPYAGLTSVGKYAKVLCGNPKHFYWMPTNSTTFHSKIAAKNPVIGGHDDLINDYLNIGRVKVGNDLKIGKIDPSKPNGAGPLYYSNDETENRVDDYFEVLMYEKDHVKER